MVNWDPGLGSAISDLEVEDREVTDTLVSIAYPLADGSGEIVVATVRPETMLGDTAVAVNPGDERYRDLVGQDGRAAAGGPRDPDRGRRARAARVRHRRPEGHPGPRRPTTSRSPAATGSRPSNVIGEDGRMTDEAPASATRGLTPAECAARVVEDLRAAGPAARRGALHPHGPVLPPLRRARGAARLAAVVLRHDPARGAGHRGGRGGPGALHASQVGRGVPRPGCARSGPGASAASSGGATSCRSTTAATRCTCRPSPRRARAGSATPTSSTPGSARRCGRSPPSAGPSETPELERFYPTQVLSTARDIIFLWVARMVMMGIEYMGAEPFSDVYIHSVVQAPDGRRMSKSLGTGIDPIEQIESHGADALRFGLLMMSSTQDVRFSPDRIDQGRQLVTKLWNAARLVRRPRRPRRRAGPARRDAGRSLDRVPRDGGRGAGGHAHGGLPALPARRPRVPPDLRRLLRLVPRAAEGRRGLAGHGRRTSSSRSSR